MSIHKFGYSVDSKQKDKIEIFEKELEPKTKIIKLKLNDVSDKLETSDTRSASGKFKKIQEINFDDGETKVVVKAKLCLDINKDTAKLASQIEDIKKI